MWVVQQQTVTFLGWIVPPFVAMLFTAIYALIRMRAAVDRLERDVCELQKRVTAHEDVCRRQDVALGQIIEGIDWIKRTLDSAFDSGREDRRAGRD